MGQTVFIVDTYSPFTQNNNVKKVFNFNNNQYCIREIKLKWGVPSIQLPIDDTTDLATGFFLYNTFEEANDYVENLIGAKL